MMDRRAALRALAASFAAIAAPAFAPSCAPSASDEVASLWFAYGDKNRLALLALVDRFNAEQGRRRIHAVHQGDYFECLAKLRTAIAAGSPPALTHVVGEVIPYLAEANVLESFEAFGHEDFGLIPALTQAGGYVGGADRPLIALPFNRSTPIAYYNIPLFRELGLTPPTTWEELRAAARKGTSRDASGNVTRFGFSCAVDWWFWIALVGQAGGAVLAPDGAPLLGGEAGVRALDLWQTMVHEDRTMKPPPGRDYDAWQVTNTDFLAGRAAMIWTSTAYLRYLETHASFAVGAAPLPRDERAAVPIGGTLFVMPKGAPRPAQESAYAFVRWMMQPAQANEWATKTGYIPVSRAGVELLEKAGYYRDHPNDRVALDQLSAVTPWPWAPTLFRVQREVVQPRLEEAILARRPSRAALDDARRAALEP